MTDRPTQPAPWLRPLRDDLVEAALFQALGGAGDPTLPPLEEGFPGRLPYGPAARRPRNDPAGELPARVDRYEVIGEIAHGGVGVVARGRDAEIGREIAIKLLLSGHVGDESMERRFLEEGQIAGQLQHPSIVPVHEIGLLGGKRPYFTMKLVRGETLDALLARRADPSERLQHFLGILLQVSEALAYAHARGVVHRDLKPANIMIGAFGEVQVMDWGLAKVLPRGPGEHPDAGPSASGPQAQVTLVSTVRSRDPASDSLAGSVLGTPAYMSPEQARGRPEDIGRRSDVFGLGAILCEILTGAPPHHGGSIGDVLARARRGDLEDARERVRAAEAEEEIKAIALHALEPRAEDRPPDAGRVAEALRVHLESTAERARAHELDAAAARARAAGERKARYRTLAGAAIVFLLFGALIVAVGILGAASERERVATALAERLEDALASMDARLGALERAAMEGLRQALAARPDGTALRDAARAHEIVSAPFALEGSTVVWPPAEASGEAEIPWEDAAGSGTERALVADAYAHLAAGREDEAALALRALAGASGGEVSFAVRAESALRFTALAREDEMALAAALEVIDGVLAASGSLPPARRHEAAHWRLALLERKGAVLRRLGRAADEALAALALLEALAGEAWQSHRGAREVHLPDLRARAAGIAEALPPEERRRWDTLLALAADQDREIAFRRELDALWLPRLHALELPAPDGGGAETIRHLHAPGANGPRVLAVERHGPDRGAALGFAAAPAVIERILEEEMAAVAPPEDAEVARGVLDERGRPLAGDAPPPPRGGARILERTSASDLAWRAWIDARPLLGRAERRVALLFGAFLAADAILFIFFTAGAARLALAARRTPE